MFSTEFLYKLKLIQQIIIKATGKIVSILFSLTSLFTVALMAYEYGYTLTPEGKEFLVRGYYIIIRIFFYGTLINMLINPHGTWREKGFWIEICILCLLLWIMITQSPVHFPGKQWLHRADHILVHILLLFYSIIQLSKLIVTYLQRRLKPEATFAYSFLAIILAGAFLLMLPKAHNGSLHFIDALFTSTSAVCITGLTTVDTSSTFTLTGQVILLFLIQIGGIGVMTFSSFIALSFFTQTSFTDQMALKNILSEDSMTNIFRTLLYTFFTTIIAEAIGTWLLWWEIRDISGEIIPDKIFFAAFHAVSAFCNAGFSTLPDNLCNAAIQHNYGFLCWIACLIIIGGIGFPIVFNYGKLINHKFRNLFYQLTGSSKRMPSHVRIVNTTTRIVIFTTLYLLAIGTTLFFLFENEHSLKDLPLRGKLAASFFGAVTPRTAGFNNLPMEMLSPATIFLTLFLMWIGASPLSTGGGIKTTTFAIALKNISSILCGKQKVEIFNRQLSTQTIRKSYAVIMLSIIWITLAVILIVYLVPDATVTKALFEVTSAISTVGLTLDFTPTLNTTGKLIISLTMFVGRVGLIVLLSSFIRQKSNQNYTYPEDHVIM